MSNNLKEMQKISEDVLSASSIAYNLCKESEEEDMIRIRPLLEVIYKKADKVCLQLLETENK